MRSIRRDFLPDQLLPHLSCNGCGTTIDGSVAVQARQSREETDWLLALADRHDFIRGVVGWIDLRAPDLEDQLATYAGQARLKGFRHIVQAEADPLFMLRPDFLRGIAQITEAGYPYDILIAPHQLGQALELVRALPRGRFVIDHAAKPYIRAGYLHGWAVALRALGGYPNCYCKVSGLVTEADYNNWTSAQLEPYLEVLFDTFPPERLMFGSDWPVCEVAVAYQRWVDLVETYLAKHCSADAARRVMGATAVEFYHL